MGAPFNRQSDAYLKALPSLAGSRNGIIFLFHRLDWKRGLSHGMRSLAVAFLIFAVALGRSFGVEPGDPIDTNIARVPVESSALASVGYSRHLQVLEVEFRNGSVYRYVDVPETVFHELMDAPSKAGYYNSNIRGRYRAFHVKPALAGQDDYSSPSK